KLASIKLGAVGLSERFITSDPPRAKDLADLRSEIHAAFQRPSRELRGTKWNNATGTSGTILAIRSAINFQETRDLLTKNQGVKPPAVAITLPRIAQLNSSLAFMTAIERRTNTGISPQRADIIVAGGLILEGAMRALGIRTLQTCDWALREGVIIDRLREW